MREKTVVVVGDYLEDEYVFGNYAGISQGGDHPIFRETHRYTLAGGAGNVARQIRFLGCRTAALAPVPLERKTRHIANGRCVFRSDTSTRRLIEARAAWSGAIHDVDFSQCSSLVISDYDKGSIDELVLDSLRSKLAETPLPTIANVRPPLLDRVEFADVCVVSAQDLLRYGRIDDDDVTTLRDFAASDIARRDGNLQTVVITMGSGGYMVVDPDYSTEFYPVLPAENPNPCGSGDAFVAALGVLAASGRVFNSTTGFGRASCVAADVATQAGTGRADRGRLLSISRDRVEAHACCSYPVAPLSRAWFAQWRGASGQLFFTNGCFDGFHEGHESLLHAICDRMTAGDRLVVALDTDERVAVLKGDRRPRRHLRQRMWDVYQAVQRRLRGRLARSIVENLHVCSFDSDIELCRLLAATRPDFLVKGGDYAGKNVVGAGIVQDLGGEVWLVPIEYDVSTSKRIG